MNCTINLLHYSTLNLLFPRTVGEEGRDMPVSPFIIYISGRYNAERATITPCYVARFTGHVTVAYICFQFYTFCVFTGRPELLLAALEVVTPASGSSYRLSWTLERPFCSLQLPAWVSLSSAPSGSGRKRSLVALNRPLSMDSMNNGLVTDLFYTLHHRCQCS